MANRLQIQALLTDVNSILLRTPAGNDGFLGGKLGTIFYLLYYGHFNNDAHMSATAHTMLVEYAEALNDERLQLNYSYCNGLAGFAYAMTHLHDAGLINIDVADEFAELDQMLAESAAVLIANHHNDFLHAAFGVLHYFSARKPTPQIKTYLNRLITTLNDNLIALDGFACIANLALPSNQVKEKINLSFSHGMNGFMIILLNLLEQGVETDILMNIIRNCASFIGSTSDDKADESFSIFPASIHINTGERKYSNRLGWCYGDLGQLLLFERLRKTTLAADVSLPSADSITYTVNRQSQQTTLATDANFCHGAAGMAQFYQALYQVSGNELYAGAYEHWINETVIFLDRDIKNNTFAGEEHSILDGYTGIALTLLSYLYPEASKWGHAVLLA